MTLVHSIKDYKNAIIYLKDLEFLVDYTERQINKYKEYEKYNVSKKIIYSLQEELGTMKAYRDKCKNIVDTKGKVLR